ncbi:MAG: 30S ribosomal protein S17 [Desulfobacterales bacterium]|nr:30S ribosomal protein S17 [Desulfobacterales bacterium]
MGERGRRKTQVGVVVGNKMDKTVVVQVDKVLKHPIYKKYISRRNKYKAHNEKNDCNVGDRVLIMESRPLSKEKMWRVYKILEKAV